MKDKTTTLIGYMIGLFVVNAIMTWIWNNVMPDMFGLKSIGYWQMFGIYLLSNYLLKTNNTLKNITDNK
jgi:TRAP-type mannitol/chloroaromatic compound transport system permease small subunit